MTVNIQIRCRHRKKAGGWEGMKRLIDTCRELGYKVIFHDQYRDYYLDAPSYSEQFAVHEEDNSQPPQQFPGSRFGDSKQGQIPLMRHWDGGPQAYLNARFQLGHLLKNYQLLSNHGITTQGTYINVIGTSPEIRTSIPSIRRHIRTRCRVDKSR
jgi:hypothetical protein